MQMYTIKKKSTPTLYLTDNDYWVIKDGSFSTILKMNKHQAFKKIVRLKDNDPELVVDVEEVA